MQNRSHISGSPTQRPVWRRGLAIFGLLAFGVLATGVAVETAVIAAFGDQVRFPRRVVGAPFGVRINQPHATYSHRSPDVEVSFRINGQGMRADRDFAYAKPPGVLRIVSLGDSFTIGYEVEVEQTFSSVLERQLRQQGLSVEVLNTGVSGYSNAEASIYLERELLRYQPDLVLLSFYGNDLVDNVRAGLFRLEDDQLVSGAESYVPAGRLGNFLNTNGLFNLLSERSNAFALAKERATLLVKRRIVAQNSAAVLHSSGRQAETDSIAHRKRLAAAIIGRMHRQLESHGIPLVVQSIPSPHPRLSPQELLELFPLDHLAVDAPGLRFVAMQPVLEPWLDRELLYHERSHGHWTPLAHRLSGERLADVVMREGLLASSARPVAADRAGVAPVRMAQGHGSLR